MVSLKNAVAEGKPTIELIDDFLTFQVKFKENYDPLVIAIKQGEYSNISSAKDVLQILKGIVNQLAVISVRWPPLSEFL